jgi:hypothetical protein
MLLVGVDLELFPIQKLSEPQVPLDIAGFDDVFPHDHCHAVHDNARASGTHEQQQ